MANDQQATGDNRHEDPRGGGHAQPPEPVARTATHGPLTGIRVLELGSFIAGPFAGQLLGDYGAEVIKVEAPPAGDPMRAWGVVVDDESLWWPGIARNKKSVAIDLRQPAGRELVASLASEVDVIVENFRPGKLTEWGLDYATLSQTNPGLVMAHISGFGQNGPRSGSPGFGSIGEAVGGIRHLTGHPEQPSTRSGISLGDSIAALFSVVGILAALVERNESGRGQEVDVALYEAVFALMESTVADYEVTGRVRSRSGPVLPGVAPSNAYTTADGDQVVIAANADPIFRRLCDAMAQPELASDPRFNAHQARGDNMATLDAVIGRWTSGLTTEDLLGRLEEHGVPAGKIFSAPDMLTDPQYLARGMIRRVTNQAGRQVAVNGVVPSFSRTPGSIRAGGPRLGEHTSSVLSGIAGTELERLAELARSGVVAMPPPDPTEAPSH